MASNKKDWVLAQMRSRYESKFGSSEMMSQLLDLELAKLSKKDKISAEDLSELENKLSSVSQTSLSVASRLESTPRKNILSPRQFRFKSGELDKSLAKSHLLDQPNLEKRESYLPQLKTSVTESSTSAILPPIATNHLNPMELKILRSYDTLPNNERMLSPTRLEESISIRSPNRGNLSPKKDLSEFKLPSNHKIVEREKTMNQNIWKKLDEYSMKRAEEEEQKIIEKVKKQKENWSVGLKKQMAEKQKKDDDEKVRDRLEAQRRIQTDVQLKSEQEEKEERHRKNMKSVERENYLEVAREKEEEKRLKAWEKEKEVLDLNNAVDEYAEEQRKLELEKSKKKKQLKTMKSEDFTHQAKKVQDKIAVEKEENVKFTENMVEKMKLDEEKTDQFLKDLKDRAKKIKDYEPAIEKGYDNLRKYGQIGKGEDPNQGVMHFLYLDKHNEQVQSEKKKKHQAILKEKYVLQKEEQVERSLHYKSYIEDQKHLWRQEEEDMNLREEVGARLSKLKKKALKEDLDAQREADSPLKTHFITPTEVWVNRKILKELKAIPEKHSDKIAYLKDF